MQTDPNRRQVVADLDRFVSTIEELIGLCARLREENRHLRQQCQELAGERAHLIEINERSRNQLESTIARLRDLEEEL